ncbi:hypothetical protein HOP50_19g84500 [Chloropicon primus]|uniref:RRM domain-containing protein n=2 Tax=Chloropicon primus TaxID=1764295 RepID=A0A5B8N022_9CHLO|nr:hypothetical protein A3770_19p84190 [Chloropicon primus]UPR05102.1 hypothetical protein HOP50_19g84500 [Chloropicon primus]|eukprot:QDZ25901.1 hypothetical protein A3770_19p84190 [Chloropicon primus]
MACPVAKALDVEVRLGLPRSTTVFVGEIPSGWSERDVDFILDACGKVKSWLRAADWETERAKHYGFCEYQHGVSCLSALEVLHGLDVGGERPLVVKPNQATAQYLETLSAKLASTEEPEEGEESQGSKVEFMATRAAIERFLEERRRDDARASRDDRRRRGSAHEDERRRGRKRRAEEGEGEERGDAKREGDREGRGPSPPVRQEAEDDGVAPVKLEGKVKVNVMNVSVKKKNIFEEDPETEETAKAGTDELEAWILQETKNLLGEEEPSLCKFIMEKLATDETEAALVDELKSFLDDEASVFVKKVFAKRDALGLK